MEKTTTNRATYQAALERHYAIRTEAGVAFATCRYILDEISALVTRRAQQEDMAARVRQNVEARGSNMAVRQSNAFEGAKAAAEIASINSLIAQLTETNKQTTTRAQILARQRDATATLVERMHDELLTLERAQHFTTQAES